MTSFYRSSFPAKPTFSGGMKCFPRFCCKSSAEGRRICSLRDGIVFLLHMGVSPSLVQWFADSRHADNETPGVSFLDTLPPTSPSPFLQFLQFLHLVGRFWRVPPCEAARRASTEPMKLPPNPARRRTAITAPFPRECPANRTEI